MLTLGFPLRGTMLNLSDSRYTDLAIAINISMQEGSMGAASGEAAFSLHEHEHTSEDWALDSRS
ncbi:MAG: hypothetical protein JWO91_1639 [Acidobacteriaceae bacterium]|nr:hypothetical protein [Acidobacteriaceae bacterium]